MPPPPPALPLILCFSFTLNKELRLALTQVSAYGLWIDKVFFNIFELCFWLMDYGTAEVL